MWVLGCFIFELWTFVSTLAVQDLLLSHLIMMLLSLEGNLIVTVQVHSCCAKCC